MPPGVYVPSASSEKSFLKKMEKEHRKILKKLKIKKKKKTDLEAESSRSAELVEESRLTDHYPAAYTDYPGGPATVYKSGPAWRQPTSPEEGPISRELRLASSSHPIKTTGAWHDVGTRIQQALDAHGVGWNSIDPVAFAEEGETKPFCPFLVWVGVEPKSLPYDTAVAAADTIKGILTDAGYPEIEVAFRESIVWPRWGQRPNIQPCPRSNRFRWTATGE